MFILYDLIFLIIGIIYLPVYLLRGKFHAGFLSRLGFLPKDFIWDSPIWIHAVSVGEAKAIAPLLGELRKAYPDKQFIISTVTPTGNKIAKTLAGKKDFVTYLPLDFSFIVRSVVSRIRPSLFIIAETEIWPNLIYCLRTKKVPIITVNGRLSDSSFKGYSLIKFLVKPVLRKIGLFCLQTELDAKRLLHLGVAEDKIRVTGNMKFDLAVDNVLLQEIREAERLRLGVKPQEKLWVCGSTHAGEEALILQVYKELSRAYSDLRLSIAPRHPERVDEVERRIIKNGFAAAKISQSNRSTGSLPAGRQGPANRPTVFILDTIGHLARHYAMADLVFVGGSLIKKGGHNILEPAALSKPILFGPYMFNFRDIADLFLLEQAVIQVRHPEDLRAKVAKLLDTPELAKELGQRAAQIIARNRGAAARNAASIKKLLSTG